MPRLPKMTGASFALRRAALVGALAMLAPAGPAGAHAFVAHSAPAAGSTVEHAPGQVRVWFSEPVAADGSELSVFDAQGTQVDRRDDARDGADPTLFRVSLPDDVTEGVYTVRWQALTPDDAARTTGEFQFGVGAAAAPAPAPATAVPWAGVGAHVRIESPLDGATVAGPEVPLRLGLQGITLIAMDGSNVPKPGTIGGHLHVSVDGTMVGMVSTDRGLVLRDMADGSHEILVALSSPGHLPYAPPLEARARVTVSGSTSSGPATLAEGAPQRTAAPPSAVKTVASWLPPWPVVAGVLLACVLLVVALAGRSPSRRAPPGDEP